MTVLEALTVTANLIIIILMSKRPWSFIVEGFPFTRVSGRNLLIQGRRITPNTIIIAVFYKFFLHLRDLLPNVGQCLPGRLK